MLNEYFKPNELRLLWIALNEQFYEIRTRLTMDHEQTILIGVHLEMKQRHMCSDKQEEVQMVVYRPPSENIFSVSVRYTVVHSMNRRSVLCQIDDPMSLTDCVISQSGRKLRKPVTSNFYSSHSQIVYLQQR